MKTSIVPAQITTVEDKVAGNLSLPQMFLLSAPIFIGSLVYLIFPPFMGGATYKLVIVVVIAAIFGLLAIRIKGRLAVLWIATISRYNLRPRYFVLNKNDMYLRDPIGDSHIETPSNTPNTSEDVPDTRQPELITTDTVKLEGIITNPSAKFRFKIDRKGALRVSIKEIK